MNTRHKNSNGWYNQCKDTQEKEEKFTMAKTPQKLYDEREKRYNDTLALKKADRIPAICIFGAFAPQFGGITQQEAMSDMAKHHEAHWKTIMEFQPDIAPGVLDFAPVFAAIDYKQLKWAGHGLAENKGFQYVEGEYMKADEYDAFLYDPSDYVQRVFWPRIFGTQQFQANLPPARSIISYIAGAATGFMPYGFPAAQEAWDALRKAGEATMRVLGGAMTFAQRLKNEAGYPILFMGVTQAPFDTLGDFMRGTRGLMLDMYRQPDKVLAACDKLLPIMIDQALGGFKATGNPRVFIPLHKGSEGFMSDEQFAKFYWPTLKALLVAIVKEGVTPVVTVQGQYTGRLKYISDVPEGKILYWFQDVDMIKARDALAGKVCVAGNVPSSLLIGGSTDQVKEYCQKLIDIFKKDGGFMLAPAVGDLEDAKPENIKAMIDYTKEHGVF